MGESLPTTLLVIGADPGGDAAAIRSDPPSCWWGVFSQATRINLGVAARQPMAFDLARAGTTLVAQRRPPVCCAPSHEARAWVADATSKVGRTARVVSPMTAADIRVSRAPSAAAVPDGRRVEMARRRARSTHRKRAAPVDFTRVCEAARVIRV